MIHNNVRGEAIGYVWARASGVLRLMIIRYLFVGGLAAIIDFVVFAVLDKFVGVPWFWSALCSFTLATAANYVLSVRFVFQRGARFGRVHDEVALVFLVSLVGLAINELVLWGCIEWLAMPSLIAKVVGTGVVFFWNFSARRYFVFQPRGTAH